MTMVWGLLLAAALTDPVGPGLRGQVQCYKPDVQRRTCASIGAYARDSEGVIQNTAVVLVSPKPLIVMRTTAPVTVKDGAICGQIASLEDAAFTIEGQPATEPQVRALRDALAPGYAALLRREVCTTYRPEGEGLQAEVRIDGQLRPDLDMPVRWVTPAEGYEVKP
jgi:hypothetical protein